MSDDTEDPNDMLRRFYMSMTYYLLDKFCDGHIKISLDEIRNIQGNNFIIKHRVNENGEAEVMTGCHPDIQN